MEDKENNGSPNFLKAPGIVAFCHEVLCTTENAINFARNNNLIKNEMVCECGFSMSLVKKMTALMEKFGGAKLVTLKNL